MQLNEFILIWFDEFRHFLFTENILYSCLTSQMSLVTHNVTPVTRLHRIFITRVFMYLNLPSPTQKVSSGLRMTSFA